MTRIVGFRRACGVDDMHNHFQPMNRVSSEGLPFGERIYLLWKRGVRLVTRAAIAFAVSTAAAIGVGAAVTDNALLQILVTVLAALAFWMPLFFITLRVDKWLAYRGMDYGIAPASEPPVSNSCDDDAWRRLSAVAPAESQRLAAVRRSLERSRLSLVSSELDPEAHELRILIERRLPDLIHHELEILPPDDRNRRQKVRELIALVEQFARHCGRRGSADGAKATFQAEVLRRRFETRLTEF